MWLITNFGFFSVVEKPDQKESGKLTIRARAKGDLEMLRDKYLASMGPIVADKGTDYKYRAVAQTVEVVAAFSKAIADIDYSNFKNSVQAEQGSARHEVYAKLWAILLKIADEPKPPAKTKSPKVGTGHKPVSYGGVVFGKGGKVLLRKPKNEFDGYVWTFPKGRPKPGESVVEAAIREVREEAGIEATITRTIPGEFEGGTTVNLYYVMEMVHNHGDFDSSKTDQVIWATPNKAKELIQTTRNEMGRTRDLAVLAAAMEEPFETKLS